MKRRALYSLGVVSFLALSSAVSGCSDDVAPSKAGSPASGAGGNATGGSSGAGGASTGTSTAGSSGAAGSTTGASGAGGSDPATGTAGNAGAGGTAGAGGSADSGGGGTAGTKDGGGSDAPSAFDGGDGCPTALFCDNFDSYTAPGNPGGMWKTSTQPGGMVSVDTMHAFSGTKAVHVMDPGSASYERAFISLEGAPVFPLPNNTMFGRMMIYVTRRPTMTVHYSLISGEGSKVPGFPNLTAAYYRYGAQIGGNQFLAQYDVQPSGQSDCAQRSNVSIPLNTWACIEWRFDGTLKEMDFWLNGTIVPALSVRRMATNGKAACQNQNWSGIWEPPTFDAIRLGWQHYQQGPGEAWIDDVGIDTKRVGCPAMP